MFFRLMRFIRLLFSRRWRVKKFVKRIRDLNYVYDVFPEQPSDTRYLVHVWVNDLSEARKRELEPKIREAVGRRPRHIKVDILLYRRDVG